MIGLLRDTSLAPELRLRRAASLGAIASVLLMADTFADMPDAALERALRAVVRDVVGNRD